MHEARRTRAGGDNIDLVCVEPPCQPLGHLAAGGVAGAEKEDAWFHFGFWILDCLKSKIENLKSKIKATAARSPNPSRPAIDTQTGHADGRGVPARTRTESG